MSLPVVLVALGYLGPSIALIVVVLVLEFADRTRARRLGRRLMRGVDRLLSGEHAQEFCVWRADGQVEMVRFQRQERLG